tara:strand:+ start:37110 stop:37505 length:396 start_codon:yes stop_codon:yes gene_type:complete
MNTVIGSLLILCLLPIICSWVGGYFRRQQLGSVDNKEPRIQSQQLSGAGARAVAAQANSWEALAVFSAAVLALFIGGVDLRSISTLVMVFVALRIAYIPAYLGNIDKLRSLLFLGSYGICMYFFYLALSTH